MLTGHLKDLFPGFFSRHDAGITCRKGPPAGVGPHIPGAGGRVACYNFHTVFSDPQGLRRGQGQGRIKPLSHFHTTGHHGNVSEVINL